MILQALNQYYDALVTKDKAPPIGFAPQKCSFALAIGDNGQLLAVEPLTEEVMLGKKKVAIPRSLVVPESVVKTAGITPQFLCDSCNYVLGLDNKGNAQKAAKCHAAYCMHQHEVLDGCDSPAIRAFLAFLDRWDLVGNEELPAAVKEDMLGGGNIVFRYKGIYVHDDPAVKDAWLRYYNSRVSGKVMTCLVTGEKAPIVNGHMKITGVRNAITMGASLIAYNDYKSAESYGLTGYENSPVSGKASFAFSMALNTLLADNRHRCFLGDATVVYWSEDASEEAQDVFGFIMEPPAESEVDEKLSNIMEQVRQGEPVNEMKMDASFYVLALSPNAGRVSVRFFLRDSFGGIVKHLQEHYDRLKIVHAPGERDFLPPWMLLRELTNLRSRDKNAPPTLAGAFLRAILTGGRYPEELLAAIMTRVRVTQDDPDKHIYRVTYGKAALIKAFLLKNTTADKEVLTVALNTEATSKPYVLGRMFSTLEQIQQAANPNINTTIKDRYFASACATPGVVFPQLLRLSSAHMGKLSGKIEEHFNKLMGEIMDKLNVADKPFPPQLSLEDQGLFFLGYYQQNQARYMKKEEK